MLNIIWVFLLVSSLLVGIWQGTLPQIVLSVTTSAKFAVDIALALLGIMALWLGVMRIAEEAGLIRLIARMMNPLLTWLFPEVPADHPARGAMVLNISANLDAIFYYSADELTIFDLSLKSLPWPVLDIGNDMYQFAKDTIAKDYPETLINFSEVYHPDKQTGSKKGKELAKAQFQVISQSYKLIKEKGN